MYDPPIRLCFITGLVGLTIKRNKLNGKFYASGITSQAVAQRFDLFATLYNLTDVHRSFDHEECFNRLGSNISDLSSHLTSDLSNSDPRYTVPAPMFVDRLVLLTGYNVTRYEMRHDDDVRNVLSNFLNFDSSTYLLTSLFIATLLACSAIRVKLFMMKSSIGPRRIIAKSPVALISFTVGSIVRGRMRSLRVLSLSALLLLLFLITCFIVIFKTDQVVVRAPDMIKSYEDILKKRGVNAIYYEALATCSDKFRDASVESTKNKIWQRTVHSGLSKSDYLVKRTKLTKEGIELAIERYGNIVDQKWVMVVPLKLSKLVKYFGCSFSPENVIWKFIIVDQTDENENFQGMAVSRSFVDEKYIIRSMRQLTESYLLEQTFINAERHIQLGYKLRRTSKKHKLIQMITCRSNIVFNDATKFINSLKIHYYLSLFLVFSIGNALALIAWLCERYLYPPRSTSQFNIGLKSMNVNGRKVTKKR